MMRAGRLDRSITIERATTAASDYGTPVASWAPLAECRAELVEATADEAIREYGAATEATVVFRIRWLDGVTLADRVSFDGRIHDIKAVKEIGRRRALELRTIARGG